MNSRTLKLLTASTAFIAAASAGNAANITTSSTVMINTSDTIGATSIANGVTLGTTGAAAFYISSSSPISNTLNVSSTGVVRSNTTAILSGLTSNAAVTVNNSGTIANTSNGAAIDLSGMTNGATIRNSGTISGSVTFGDGTNLFNNYGSTSGTITGGANADTVNLVHGTHVGNINLGTGANGLTVSNSTVTGNYTGGAGVDTINIKDGSTFTGNITTGIGADNVTISGSTLHGNLSTSVGGSSADTNVLTLTNAVVNGNITDAITNDNDSLIINGANTFTTGGTIAGYEGVQIKTNVNLNNAMTGVSTLSVDANKIFNINSALNTSGAVTNAGTINANQSFAGTGGLTNTGHINVAAGKTLTAATYAGTGTLGLGLTSSNTTTGIGKVIVSAGGVTAPSLTINVGTNAGYIASGTQYVAIDATGATTNATLTNTTSGVYRFSTSVSNTDQILLKVGRVSTNSVVTGSDNKAAAAAIDSLSASNNASVVAVQSAIGAQTTAAGVNNVVESLTPSIDGAGFASLAVTVDTGNQVSNRLASVRTKGIATGDSVASDHMWVQGFGSSVEQDSKGGNAGYDASGGGVSFGLDTDTLVNGFTTGAAISYAHGNVDSKSSSNASTDIDSYIGTIYAGKVLDNGVFVNGQVGGGYNKYDMKRTIIGVGSSNGDTDGFQGTAKLEAGKDFAVNKFVVTPLASVQYTYLDIDSYTETGAGGASLTVDPKALSTVDAGAGGELAYPVALTDGGTLKPSVHAKYVYRMGDTEMGTTNSFTGGGASFNTSGVKADRSSVNLGAGILLTTIGGTDLSLNYDADIRSNLTGHTGQLKARWAF